MCRYGKLSFIYVGAVTDRPRGTYHEFAKPQCEFAAFLCDNPSEPPIG